jgi:two-component system, NtrC family, response regulator HydG
MSNAASVLVVDDSQGICQTMSMILKRKGFDVECVGDGPAAIVRARERPFDVFLLDIRLPGMDGVEVFKRLKPVRPAARFAMMTAYALEDKVRAALECGAEKVFYKPLEMDTIIGFIAGGPAAAGDKTSPPPRSG